MREKKLSLAEYLEKPLLADPLRVEDCCLISDGGSAFVMTSVERARDLGCRQLFPGHGPPLPGKALDKLIDHRRERERKVLAQLAATRAELSEIAARAYDDVPRMPLVLTERQTLSHLLLLERQGKVRRIDGAGRGWCAV